MSNLQYNIKSHNIVSKIESDLVQLVIELKKSESEFDIIIKKNSGLYFFNFNKLFSPTHLP